MTKVLLQNAGKQSAIKCQEDLAKMVKIAVAVQSSMNPEIEMISVQELHAKATKDN